MGDEWIKISTGGTDDDNESDDEEDGTIENDKEAILPGKNK